MPNQPLFEKLSLHPFLILLIGCGTVVLGIAFAQLIVMSLLNISLGYSESEFIRILSSSELSDAQEVMAYKLTLGMVQIIGFGGVAIVLAQGFSNSKEILGFRQIPKTQHLILAPILLIMSLPLMQWLVIDQDTFSLPVPFQELEQWAKSKETQSELLLKSILNQQVLLNILIIGIVPALSEELFFRGFVQSAFKKVFNIHLTIILTGFIFSMVHLQMYGFLPRMLMGMLFGYMLLWSGSIIPCILAHFTNNALSVLLAYFALNNDISASFLDSSPDIPWYVVLLSTLSTGTLLAVFYKSRLLNKE